MAEELKKGDEVSWNWGSGQPCTFPLILLHLLRYLLFFTRNLLPLTHVMQIADT
jgi:hypothetical protein